MGYAGRRNRSAGPYPIEADHVAPSPLLDPKSTNIEAVLAMSVSKWQSRPALRRLRARQVQDRSLHELAFRSRRVLADAEAS